MLKRRWLVLAGPPFILILAVAVIANLGQPVAKAVGVIALPRLGHCPSTAAVAVGTAQLGTWWKTQDHLDSSGALVGRELFVGHDAGSTAHLDLPVESSVSGPVDGLVVLSLDDGSRSQIQLVSVAGRCGVLVHGDANVVRGAILDPRDGAIFAHLVDRGSRADLGTFRVPPAGTGAAELRLVVPPLPLELQQATGLVFGTTLKLDRQATHLAVQSCSDGPCITRIVDLAVPDARPVVLRDRQQGPLIGFAGNSLVTWAACGGLPCSILAWDLGTGRARALASGQAAALTPDGRRLVVTYDNGAGAGASEIDTATGRSTGLRALPEGRFPVPGAAAAVVGLEVAADEVAMTSLAGDPFPFRPDAAAVEPLP